MQWKELISLVWQVWRNIVKFFNVYLLIYLTQITTFKRKKQAGKKEKFLILFLPKIKGVFFCIREEINGNENEEGKILSNLSSRASCFHLNIVYATSQQHKFLEMGVILIPQQQETWTIICDVLGCFAFIMDFFMSW